VTLSVIETLRKHQPKSKQHSAKSSGTRTPVFWFGSGGGGGGTPFNEKEHYNFLSGALKRAATPTPHVDSEGEDGDVEDGDGGRSKKKKKGKQKRSVGPVEKEHSGNTLSNTVKSEVPSTPATPSGLNKNHHATDSTHRYPPSGSTTPARRNSWDEGDTTLITAAKVLKTAVLHDARNIKGKDAGLKPLAWNVNSSREAHVGHKMLGLLKFKFH
jgi:hypothetical protein